MSESSDASVDSLKPFEVLVCKWQGKRPHLLNSAEAAAELDAAIRVARATRDAETEAVAAFLEERSRDFSGIGPLVALNQVADDIRAGRHRDKP